MSRSGYTDVEDPMAYGRWRQAVKRSIEGKRGQAFLRELVAALDEMPDKRLYTYSFATAEGEFCALGIVGKKRRLKLEDLGDEFDCDAELVADRFGIAGALACEIMYLNDEHLVDLWQWQTVELCGPIRPLIDMRYRVVCTENENHAHQRWRAMRNWALENIKQDVAA